MAKLKAARIRRRRVTGRCEGRKPFGTKPGEEEALALIRRLRPKPRGEKRLSFDTIAARLNADGVPTRSGKAWVSGTVYGILNNGRNLR